MGKEGGVRRGDGEGRGGRGREGSKVEAERDEKREEGEARERSSEVSEGLTSGWSSGCGSPGIAWDWSRTKVGRMGFFVSLVFAFLLRPGY